MRNERKARSEAGERRKERNCGAAVKVSQLYSQTLSSIRGVGDAPVLEVVSDKTPRSRHAGTDVQLGTG